MQRGKIYLASIPPNLDTIQSLDWLCSQSAVKLWVFYDLDAVLAAVIGGMPLTAQKDLATKGKVVWRGFDMFYEPRKIFCICKDGGENHKYYNLSQYFPDYDLSDPMVAERCVQELENALQSMNIWTDTLTSPAAIYEKYYMHNLNIPKAADMVEMDRGLLEYAVNCADREWTETFKIGHFDEVWEYDVSGAYPNIMRYLYDPRYMEVLQSPDYQPEAVYGFCKYEGEIDRRVKVCPIIYIDQSGSHSTPVGYRKDFISKDELDFTSRFHLGHLDIIDGYWLFMKTEVQPLEHVLKRLLEFKTSPIPLVQFLAKEMSVGIYGKFGQEFRGGVGDFFNPIWFAETSIQCRLKVGEFIYKNKCWDNLIQVRKDSVMVDRPLEHIPNGWRLAYHGEAIVISNDLTFLENRHPRHWTLGEVKKRFTEEPRTAYYEKKLASVVTLDDAAKRKAYQELGRRGQTISSVDLYRLRVDREFDDLPRTGGDVMTNVYCSKPLEVVSPY